MRYLIQKEGTNMGFGTVLKELLAQKNMSIKELSEIAGIPLNTLYSITKRDSTNIRPETLEKIANALGTPSDQIVKSLQESIFKTQQELEDLQYRLYKAEELRQRQSKLRHQLATCLQQLTNYEFTNDEIDIIISTAVLLKDSSFSADN